MTTDSKATREEMPKAYNPASVEGPTYQRWEQSGAFTPFEPGAAPSDPDAEPYTIIMPPPNLTGELHLGHAMMDTVEDILVRWRRMQGKTTLWLPGVDHAAIAVHTLIERQLADEGLTRQDVGREGFLERTWEFVNRNRQRIFAQHKRLGISADWSREKFTMDPGPAKAVRRIFVDLYEKGLIYRGNRLINWCPKDQSALSDLEVDHEDDDSFLWHVKYPLFDDETASSPSQRRARRRSWPTRRSRFTRTTSATRPCGSPAPRRACRSSGASCRSSRTRRSTLRSAPAP